MEFTTHLVEEDLADLGSHRPAWHTKAACLGMGTEMFFTEGRIGPGRAFAVCATCPVAAECLAYAIEAGELGIWGGVSASQRRQRPAA